MYVKLRLVVLLAFAQLMAFGQSGLGSIAGSVLDTSKASIPNATITVVQVSTNTERTTTTNEAGMFTIPSLVPSTYTLKVSAPGFKEQTVSNLELSGFQNMTLGAITMEVGGGAATVIDVTAEAVQLATESAVRDNAIESKQVTEMPLQGRAWISMMKVIPGAMAATSQGVTGREAGYDGLGDFRINGKNTSSTQMNLDGGGNVDHGTDGKTTVTASLESIQEISVLTNNFQAEYGNRSGSVINVTTKSGTNKYHVTLWDYVRNEALNANLASSNMQGLPRDKYRYNYLGGNFGGPVLKNKVFVFVNHEEPKINNTVSTTLSRVPTALERTGDFSQTLLANGSKPVIYYPGTQAAGAPIPIPGNVLPAPLLNSIGQRLANLYPLPNYAGNLTSNYVNYGSGYDKRWLSVGRMDWNITQDTRAYLRFTYDYQHRRTPGAMPWNPSGWDRPDRALSANVTHMFSPTLVMEGLFAWQLDFVHAGLFLFDLTKIDRNQVGLSDIPLVYPNVQLQYLKDSSVKLLPNLTNTGFYDYNFGRTPWYAKAPEYQWSDKLTWVKGSHVVKAGIQIIVNKKNEWDNSTAKGAFDFAVNTSSSFDTGYNQANMLTGAINQFQQVDNPAVKYSMYVDTDFFMQDTWKVIPSLTLDYGLRLYHIPGEQNTRPELTKAAMFDPAKYDPKQAPRFYIPNPANTKTLIDPLYPNAPLPANVFNALLYSLVPGSGNLKNGIVDLNGASAMGNPRWLLFAPRGGFAWQMNPNTVIRGGFGWSYGRPNIGQAITPFENGLSNAVDYRMTSFSTLTSSSVSRVSPRNYGGYDQSTTRPQTVYDYSLSIQRELPLRILFDVAWVGNLQRHQVVTQGTASTMNLNWILPGTAWQSQYIDSRVAGNNLAGTVSASNPGALPGTQTVDSNMMRPYLGVGNITAIPQVGNNRYNSLQVTANKRYTHGFALSAAYTYGKLITGTENIGSFYYNWKQYTGYAANNERGQTLSANYTYEVPALTPILGLQKSGLAKRLFDNWGIAHVIGWMSGRLQTPTFTMQYANSTSAIANFNAIFTGSPDIAPRILPISSPNTVTDSYHQFDTSVLTVPSLTAFGMGSRSYLKTPGTFSNDITVTKQIAVKEGVGFELRASVFNLFNSARYQDVITAANYKANGATFASGQTLINTPEALQATLLKSNPSATAQALYSQYRTGVGSTDLTSVLDPRRIELTLRFKF